ncbi:hypothetical protein [Candidatus Poriferisodalis sp.]|uniref:hypothetical protein n=1 Tax=Candidatus Poriferisodalis sp. TaxID=3101277 RepID=UPI003B5B8490
MIAVEDERLHRVKRGNSGWHASPARDATKYCLDAAGLALEDLDRVFWESSRSCGMQASTRPAPLVFGLASQAVLVRVRPENRFARSCRASTLRCHLDGCGGSLVSEQDRVRLYRWL